MLPEIVVVAMTIQDGVPRVLTNPGGATLPRTCMKDSLPLAAQAQAWTQGLGGMCVHSEQLYTYAERWLAREPEAPILSVSYLCACHCLEHSHDSWAEWYAFFPWEDRRTGDTKAFSEQLVPRLMQWCTQCDDSRLRDSRTERVLWAFGLKTHEWNDELILQRYQLLYEAGLVMEAARRNVGVLSCHWLGRPMEYDHRRILATAIARVRAKTRYEPLIYKLLPVEFTLLELQRAAEAIVGRPMHKQNFRRWISSQGELRATGRVRKGQGRPARLYRSAHALRALSA